MAWPWWALLVAVSPIVLLAVLVLRSQPMIRSAWMAAALAALAAATAFGLGGTELLVALARGLWTGGWILAIVLPALLLFEVVDRSGALDQLADAAVRLAPTEGRRLLLLAWILPSFLQGAAGFGAPIAMSAPMLVRSGLSPVAAVSACLIGYQWSVTFGSMGSSYFMAEATARLDAVQASSLALRTGLMLAVTAVVSGFLVLRRGASSAGDAVRALVLGVLMGSVLVLVVVNQPALGSIAAGLAGLVGAWWLLPDRGGERPGGRPLLVAASPYVALTMSITAVYAIPPLRRLADAFPEVAPVLPGSTAGFGFTTSDATVSPVFRPALHPLVWILLAVVVAVLVYRRRGWWPPGSSTAAARSWVARCRSVGPTILGLTVLAAILTEAGMVAAVAEGLSQTLGLAFVAFSVPLGSFGTILTGSTTASNALFASLQGQVATALAIAPAILVAGQTAGGNIGNALAPAVAAVGASATGAEGEEGAVLRRNVPAAALLVLIVVASLILQVGVERNGGIGVG